MGARKKGATATATATDRLTPRRWENAGLTEEGGRERKRNEEERDFDFSSGEKVSNHGEFGFEASPSSHDRECGW